MKFLLIFVFAWVLISSNQLFAENFNADFVYLDSLIEHAEEVDLGIHLTFNQADNAVIKQKNPFVAWVLTYTIVGFHRLYLGTEFTTFLAYFFTLGGFLIVDIIDYGVLLFALLENKPIDKYVDNPNFFMWN